jgi:hypothetical protein
MASQAVGLAGLTGPVGLFASIGAALFDSMVLMPALQGKGRNAARPSRMLGAPIGDNGPAHPRRSAAFSSTACSL